MGHGTITAGTLLLLGIAGLPSSCAEPAGTAVVDETGQTITRVTEGLRSELGVAGRPAPATFSLEQRMAFYNVPGVSIAVVEHGEIAWARGFGTKEVGTSDSVTSQTLFQAGSISKPVTATGMLHLVRNGELELDAPVNRYLQSWTLPGNGFTANEKVTLRRIASHSGGLTVHGFPGYGADDRIPTLPEILDGTGAANTEAVRVDMIPGTIWRYSGGGTTIEQLVMTDQTGERFPDLMKRIVFDPTGMTQSTYEQPLPETLQVAAASGHGMDGNVISGRWRIYPEMAAAGLWTTPTDLLRWAMEIDAARDGRSERVLSVELATEMLTIQQATSGLGPFLGGNRGALYFAHGGVTEGFVSQVIYFPDTEQGGAVMTNGDGGFLLLSQEILFSVATEYGWPAFLEVIPLPVDSSDLLPYLGEYFVTGAIPITISIIQEEGRLIAEASDWTAAFGPIRLLESEEIVLTAPEKAIGLSSGVEFSFDVSDNDVVSQFEAFGLTFLKQ